LHRKKKLARTLKAKDPVKRDREVEHRIGSYVLFTQEFKNDRDAKEAQVTTTCIAGCPSSTLIASGETVNWNGQLTHRVVLWDVSDHASSKNIIGVTNGPAKAVQFPTNYILHYLRKRKLLNSFDRVLGAVGRNSHHYNLWIFNDGLPEYSQQPLPSSSDKKPSPYSSPDLLPLSQPLGGGSQNLELGYIKPSSSYLDESEEPSKKKPESSLKEFERLTHGHRGRECQCIIS